MKELRLIDNVFITPVDQLSFVQYILVAVVMDHQQPVIWLDRYSAVGYCEKQVAAT